MKVLLGYLTQQFRGSIKFQLDFASHFRDVEVGFVTSNPHVDYEEQARAIGPIHVIPPTKRFAARLQALKALAQEYDVIYLNKATLNVFENFLVRKAGFRKIVFHSHSTGKDCKNPLIKGVYHALHYVSRIGVSRWCHRMYACSPAAGNWLFGPRNANRVTIVNNGIDVARYRFDPAVREKKRRELGITQKTVLHAGAFSGVKNQGYLVRAFAALHQQDPDTVLLFAGDGELRQVVEQQVCDLHLTDCVRFLGYRTDVPELMQAADLFVLPSTTEGLPFVAIEAQAAGLPCILTAVASPQTKATAICEFFDVTLPPVVLAQRMAAVLAQPRRDTADEVIAAGFDLQHCAHDLETDLQSN